MRWSDDNQCIKKGKVRHLVTEKNTTDFIIVFQPHSRLISSKEYVTWYLWVDKSKIPLFHKFVTYPLMKRATSLALKFKLPSCIQLVMNWLSLLKHFCMTISHSYRAICQYSGRPGFNPRSYQRLKKWHLMPPCLALNTIRWGSKVKWSNPGNGEVSFPTPQLSSCQNVGL